MGCVFEGIQRRDLYELPPDALRELVVNAFAHRNYFEHNAPIFVAVYDTRVEITSPGGLPRGLTVEKALSGRSKIRNHALAEAFNYMKVIEEWGSGLRRVSNELAAYGAKPLQFEDGGIDVRINVLRNVEKAEKPHIATEKPHIVTEKPHIGSQKERIAALKLTEPTHKNILVLCDNLKSYGAFGRKDVCLITGLRLRAASALISQMLTHKLIEPVSGCRKRAYRFVD